MVGGGDSKLESIVQAMWKEEQGGNGQLCQFWATHPLPIIRQVNRPPLCCLLNLSSCFYYSSKRRYGKCKPGLWVCDPRCYGGGHFPGAKFLRKLSFNSSDGSNCATELPQSWSSVGLNLCHRATQRMIQREKFKRSSTASLKSSCLTNNRWYWTSRESPPFPILGQSRRMQTSWSTQWKTTTWRWKRTGGENQLVGQLLRAAWEQGSGHQ